MGARGDIRFCYGQGLGHGASYAAMAQTRRLFGCAGLPFGRKVAV
jgi:hypothetical protein